eukprot:m.62151 g.62151  ORF g.62151 m.62151 type:complete len:761 (-) comp8019_c1_seq2:1213-3495(-)
MDGYNSNNEINNRTDCETVSTNRSQAQDNISSLANLITDGNFSKGRNNINRSSGPLSEGTKSKSVGEYKLENDDGEEEQRQWVVRSWEDDERQNQTKMGNGIEYSCGEDEVLVSSRFSGKNQRRHSHAGEDNVHLFNPLPIDSVSFTRKLLRIFRSEFWSILKLAAPTSLATSARLLVYSSDTAFLGHLGTDELVASALAESFLTIAVMFMYGGASAINTLGAQAFGAKNYHLVGTWLQVGLLCMTVLGLPVILVLFFTGHLVGLVNDNENVIKLAGKYARWSSLYIIPMGWYSAVRMYFQVQDIVIPSVVVSVLAIFINIGFNILFIHGVGSWKGFGFIGSPLATTATMVMQMLLFLMYTVWYKGYHKLTWPGWHLKGITWTRFKLFLKMAVSCGLALTADEGVFQVLFLISGRLSTREIAGLGVSFQWINFVWGAWWGFGLATMIRLGHNLGAGKPRRARVSFLVGYILSFVLLLILCAAALIFHNYLGMPFSSDPEVISASSNMAIFLAGCVMVYCLGSTIMVSIEATGRYVIVLVSQVALSLGVTLPLGYVFCFVFNYGAAGLLVGVTIGNGFKGLVSFLLMYFVIDWKKESQRAIERAAEDDNDNDDDDDDDVDGGAKKLERRHSKQTLCRKNVVAATKYDEMCVMASITFDDRNAHDILVAPLIPRIYGSNVVYYEDISSTVRLCGLVRHDAFISDNGTRHFLRMQPEERNSMDEVSEFKDDLVVIASNNALAIQQLMYILDIRNEKILASEAH